MNKAQKAGIIGISSALLLTGAIPAAAAQEAVSVSTDAATANAGQGESVVTDTKIKRDEAVNLARKYAQVPADYVVNNVSLQLNRGLGNFKFPVWTISFNKEVEGRSYGNFYVRIHADKGTLVQFSSYLNDVEAQPSYPPKVSFQQAKPVAEAFAKELYPSEWQETRYNPIMERNFKTPLGADVRYVIRYDRIINDVAFSGNGIQVTVDGDGKIVEFSYTWDDQLQFPKLEGILPKQEAFSKWKDSSGLTLTYFKPYDRISKDDSFSIGYFLRPLNLDAATGKLLDSDENRVRESSPLTAQPLGAGPVPGKALNKEQAIKAITDTFTLPAGAKLEDASYNEYSQYNSKELQGTWNIRWSLAKSEAKAGSGQDASTDKIVPGDTIYASVNALTGQIKSFNLFRDRLYSEEEGKKEYKIELQAAKDKAVEFVKKAAPHLTHQLILEYQKPVEATAGRGTPLYHINFVRSIDGILTDESADLVIDGITGDIIGYDNSLSSNSYHTSKPAVISEEKARALWADQYELELQYVMDYSLSPDATISIEKLRVMQAAGDYTSIEDVNGKVLLAYVPVAKHAGVGTGIFLDAVSGEWKSARTGENAKLVSEAPADVEGHWASRELELMVEYGALDMKDGKVNPDQAATRGELIKMLVVAMNGGNSAISYDSARGNSFKDVLASSKYYAYVENAVDLNLIDRNPQGDFNPDKIMTREDMAELIVRALGYNNLAKRTGLFQLNVEDAAQIVNKGHAALLLGLGIMSAQDGKFLPQVEVTRAQAAVAFFRYLEQRSILKDQAFY